MAEQILNLNDERTKIIVVPEWNDMKILCKNLTGADRAIISKMLTVDGDTNEIKTDSTTADLVLLGAYNPDTGDRIFAQSQRSMLLAKNSKALELIATTIQELSGLSKKSRKDAEKN